MRSTMNRLYVAALTLVVAIALSGCNDGRTTLESATLALQQEGGASAVVGTGRPFQGTLEASFSTESGHPDCPGRPGLVRNTGEGTATHLGRFTAEFAHCAATPEQPTLEGEFVWTAANGDQPFGTYGGALAPDLPLSSTITGGTGRFLNATGELTQEVTLDFIDFDQIVGTVAIRSEGRIAYDASDRRKRP